MIRWIILFVLAWSLKKEVSADPLTSQRIINGRLASKGQFPWQAAIFIQGSGFTTTCGGALISDQWILTAGHCVYRGQSFTVYLGSNSLIADDPNRLVATSSVSILHEQYAPLTLTNDIGLVFLSSFVIFTDTITSVILPSSPLVAGTTVTVSGWGLTRDDGDGASENLYYTYLTTISDSTCRETFGPLSDGVVCAQSNSSQVQATCEGDSGGPATATIGGNPVLVGIVSFGNSEGCESGLPEGYTRTFYYRDWIKNKTGV